MERAPRKSSIVKTSLPIAGSDDRAVLFYWASSEEPRLRNVARVDRLGDVVWRAELPGDVSHDCFISLRADGADFLAQTYSGLITHFDANGRQRPLAE